MIGRTNDDGGTRKKDIFAAAVFIRGCKNAKIL